MDSIKLTDPFKLFNDILNSLVEIFIKDHDFLKINNTFVSTRKLQQLTMVQLVLGSLLALVLLTLPGSRSSLLDPQNPLPDYLTHSFT